jgi:UrcA family protein
MTTSTFSGNNVTSFFLALAASGAILGFAAGPAEAAPVPVSVSAFDLATPAGRAAVDARIEAAAEKACRSGDEGTSLAARQAFRGCVAKAVDGANADITALSARVQMASR